MTETPAKRPYHHGDLAATLVAVAVDLVAESGPHGFSLAEASRRAGVSVAAPYRHFRTREDLLVAVGVHGYDLLTTDLSQAVASAGRPEEQLAAAARAYIAWVESNPALYDVLFASGIDKKQHPALLEAAARSFQVLASPALPLSGKDPELAADLATAVGVVAHGYATLFRDGNAGPADQTGARAAAATRALIRGRKLLRSG